MLIMHMQITDYGDNITLKYIIKDAWPCDCKKSIRWTHFKQQVLKYLSSNKRSKNEYISNTK